MYESYMHDIHGGPPILSNQGKNELTASAIGSERKGNASTSFTITFDMSAVIVVAGTAPCTPHLFNNGVEIKSLRCWMNVSI